MKYLPIRTARTPPGNASADLLRVHSATAKTEDMNDLVELAKQYERQKFE
jgi:hypothetical protein